MNTVNASTGVTPNELVYGGFADSDELIYKDADPRVSLSDKPDAFVSELQREQLALIARAEEYQQRKFNVIAACAAPTCRNTVGGPSELALQEGRSGVMMITRRITRSQAKGTGGFIRAGETLLSTWPFNGWEDGERPAGAARRRRSSANRYLGLSHLIFTSQSRFCLKPTWPIEPVGKNGSPELTVPTRGHKQIQYLWPVTTQCTSTYYTTPKALTHLWKHS
jgi:hypothetical protein